MQQWCGNTCSISLPSRINHSKINTLRKSVPQKPSMFCCFWSEDLCIFGWLLNPPMHREKKEMASLWSMERRQHYQSSSAEQSPGSSAGPYSNPGHWRPTCAHNWLRNRPQQELTEGTGWAVVPPEWWSCVKVLLADMQPASEITGEQISFTVSL